MRKRTYLKQITQQSIIRKKLQVRYNSGIMEYNFGIDSFFKRMINHQTQLISLKKAIFNKKITNCGEVAK